MQKRMMLMVVLLLLVSCSRVPQGERPTDTAAVLKAVQTGTQGVQLVLLPNYPPAIVYDQNPLVALVEIHNRGNHNLEAADCFMQVTGFDPNILRGGLETPRSCAENVGGPLEGKNVYNLLGGFNQLEFRSSSIQLPPGVYDYNPTLNFVTCYNYVTQANPLVCLDPLFYQITSQQKTCIPHDVSMAGGQGGPVGVSYIGVTMTGGKAIFEINVINYGGGRVLSPNALIQQCGQGSLQYTDVDKVEYSVQLSGGTPLDCRPRDGIVRLVNNQGKLVCTAQIAGTAAYETPLQIQLSYGYQQSLARPVKIVKTPE